MSNYFLISYWYIVQSKYKRDSRIKFAISFILVLTSIMPTYPEVGTILSWGTAQLEPVITGVKSIMVEFIPYVIYIAIGVLIATLGFVAVKWLMNWMSRRVTWTFSSRRKRR